MTMTSTIDKLLDEMGSLVIPVAAGLLIGGFLLNRMTAVEDSDEPEETEGDEEVKEAHVEPARQAAIARDWGTVPRVSTERNILAGQAVGQTIDYTLPVGQSPQGTDPINANWTAYSYTLMTTEPTFGQNYFGRATGVQ